MNELLLRRRVAIQEEKPFSEQYLTFIAFENGTFKQTATGGTNAYGSVNGGQWASMNGGGISVSAGDIVRVRGVNNISSNRGNVHFSASGAFKVQGNPLSVIFGDDFVGKDLTNNSYGLYQLFKDNAYLVDAENMFLSFPIVNSGFRGMFNGCTGLVTPPKIIGTEDFLRGTYGCNQMFYGCTSLTTAPELPATTSADSCYHQMFYGCSSLATAPELPATTLAGSCYREMFYGCTALTTAPELPASTPQKYCYNGMFRNCANLNYIKCLLTRINAAYCLDNWVSGVSASGTFVKSPNITTSTWGANIPSGWTVEDYTG